MNPIEAMAALQKEIADLNTRIDKSDTVQKADIAKLIERLDAYGKMTEPGSELDKVLPTSNPMSFWQTKRAGLGFADFLADGPLKKYHDENRHQPIFKDRLNKISDAMSVATVADGGYLAPTQYSSYILDRGLSYGQTLSRFPRVPVVGKDFDIACNDTDLAALWAVSGGGSTSEDHTKTAQKMVFGHVTLTPKTMYAVRFATNKLLRQSRFAIANLVGNDLAKAIAKRTAHAVWLADGTDDATNGNVDGIKTKSGIGEVNLTTASQLYTVNATGSPADSDATVKGMDAIVKCMNKATSRAYQEDTAFYCHRVTLNDMYSLKDTTGQPIVRDVFVNGFGMTPTIRGYPVITDEIFDYADGGSSAGDMLLVFGSAQQGGAIGYNEEVAISFSEHVRWLNNQSGWKAEIEIDFQVTDVGAWSRILV